MIIKYYDSKFWIDEKLFWTWSGPESKMENDIQFKIPDAPSKKKIDYLNYGFENDYDFVIGVWDDEIYTPLNRIELSHKIDDGHLISERAINGRLTSLQTTKEKLDYVEDLINNNKEKTIFVSLHDF
jgi:hypothetical protein